MASCTPVIGNGPIKSPYLCNDFWNEKSDSSGMTSIMTSAMQVLVLACEELPSCEIFAFNSEPKLELNRNYT
jgi:hypothetical protein